MAENVMELTDSTFEAEVLQAKGLVLVDFWAPWCVPCRMLAPTIEDLATEFEGKVRVAKLDTQDHRKAAAAHQISALPTVLLFKDGQVVESVMGVPPKEKFVSLINKHLGQG